MGSLDPRQSVESLLLEGMKAHGLAKDEKTAAKRLRELLSAVGLPTSALKKYPHEFSGGQRQRIGIARALSVNPKLIVADEPVSALDVSVQAQVINLLEELQDQFGLTYLVVAHDLAVVRHISDRIGVMYLGALVEEADADDLYAQPLHPYTRALMSAVPVPDPLVEDRRERILLTGDLPSRRTRPRGAASTPAVPGGRRRSATPSDRSCGSSPSTACPPPTGWPATGPSRSRAGDQAARGRGDPDGPERYGRRPRGLRGSGLGDRGTLAPVRPRSAA